MEIKGIKYTGPIFDGSGYAQACRGNIMALLSLGVPVTLNPISFEKIKPDLGEEGEVLKPLVGKKIDYNVNLIHSTPEFWEKNKEEGGANVGYTIWETSRLHPAWPEYINSNVDMCLVGCEWNIEVFRNSGVTIPMGVVPHGIKPEDYEACDPFHVQGLDKDAYVFYSIFQWTERKNPLDMIKAYWYAFQNDENVALVLKTYRSDYSDAEKDAIRTTLKRLRQVTIMDKYPPIYLIPNMLTGEEMCGLHARGDCYVSLDRGEGFGLGPFAAGASGNPIIVTGFGGTTEYAKPDNSYLVDYTLEPVFGMPWSPWYRGNQLWARPNVLDGAEKMRHVYENQDEAKEIGQKLKKHISENFNWNAIGQRIIDEVGRL
jgi:glycosyltransferase involved in cell wall biosynthesis